MKRHLFTAWLLAMVLAMAACGGGEDYSDAVEVNQDFVNAMKTYLDDVEKADSGSTLADAINSYADRVEELAPKMKALAEKYPDLRDRARIPEKLKPLAEESEALAKQMAGSFMKAMKYMQDEKVQAAQQRLIKSMTAMK